MRKTIYEAKQFVYGLLNTQNILNQITGEVWKDKKPANSTNEDIVINAIQMDSEYLQDVTLNVNCYVPNLNENINGITQSLPDNERLEEIAKLIYPILHNAYGQGFNIVVEAQKEFDEEAENARYINFRLNMKVYNN